MTFRIPMILNNEHFTGLGAIILERIYHIYHAFQFLSFCLFPFSFFF